MRFYLSSFKLGEQQKTLLSMYDKRRPIGYCANALDHVSDKQWLKEWMSSDMAELNELGLPVQLLDLRDYFDGSHNIEETISQLSGFWFSGGNVFVLRQAMRLSGLDRCLSEIRLPEYFVYGGYSAGCCVLSPTLRPYASVDNPDERPYAQIQETLWYGLGLIDFVFMPHFRSRHSESVLIETEISYCIKQQIPYRVFRDGDVFIV